jgi:hypothetical protein
VFYMTKSIFSGPETASVPKPHQKSHAQANFLNLSDYMDLATRVNCSGVAEKLCTGLKLSTSAREGLVLADHLIFIFIQPERLAQEQRLPVIKDRSGQLSLIALKQLLDANELEILERHKVNLIHLVLINDFGHPGRVHLIKTEGLKTKTGDQLRSQLPAALQTGKTTELMKRYQEIIPWRDLYRGL